MTLIVDFPTRFRLRIILNGEEYKVFKSKDLKYLMGIRREYIEKYKADEVEFRIIASNVNKCAKPRYKSFSNMPEEGFEDVAYGVNSDNDYYLMDLETQKVIRLKEVI